MSILVIHTDNCSYNVLASLYANLREQVTNITIEINWAVLEVRVLPYDIPMAAYVTLNGGVFPNIRLGTFDTLDTYSPGQLGDRILYPLILVRPYACPYIVLNESDVCTRLLNYSSMDVCTFHIENKLAVVPAVLIPVRMYDHKFHMHTFYRICSDDYFSLLDPHYEPKRRYHEVQSNNAATIVYTCVSIFLTIACRLAQCQHAFH